MNNKKKSNSNNKYFFTSTILYSKMYILFENIFVKDISLHC